MFVMKQEPGSPYFKTVTPDLSQGQDLNITPALDIAISLAEQGAYVRVVHGNEVVAEYGLEHRFQGESEFDLFFTWQPGRDFYLLTYRTGMPCYEHPAIRHDATLAEDIAAVEKLRQECNVRFAAQLATLHAGSVELLLDDNRLGDCYWVTIKPGPTAGYTEDSIPAEQGETNADLHSG